MLTPPHLGVSVFISHEDHGDAMRQQERCCQVAHLPLPQAQHIVLCRLALSTAVPGQIVVLPIPAQGRQGTSGPEHPASQGPLTE